MTLAEMTPQGMIEFIAKTARAMGHQAGVGAMETAGALVSYLADHPKDLEPFVNGGIFELPMDWHTRGSLTWHGINGKVVSPEFARHSQIIKTLATETDA